MFDGEPPFERLHPYSVLFQIGAQLRALVVPAVVYVFAGEGSALRFLILLFVLPTLVQPVLHYLSFRYQLRRTEMVVRDGVFFRNERRIPYARIHNVDMVQNPLHRLFKVAMIKLETASGGKPEAVIRVLSLDALERLRKAVRATHDTAETSREEEVGAAGALATRVRAPSETTLLRLGPRDLVRLGLISNQGLVVIGGAIALLFQQNWIDWERIDWQETVENATWLDWAPGLAESADRIGEWVGSGGWLVGATLAGIAAVAAIIGLYLFSIVLAFLRFWGFSLVRQGDDLRAQMGLLTRVTQTTPRRRIQHLRVHQGPIHRLFGRSSIRIDTAGGSGEGSGGGGFQPQGAGGSSKQWLAPLIEDGRELALLQQALPEVGIAADLLVGVGAGGGISGSETSSPETSSPETSISETSSTESLAETSRHLSGWRPIEQRAWKRRFKRGAALSLLATAGISWLSLWGLLIAVVALPLQLILARRYVRCRHYLATDHAIFWRSGWWRRNLSIVPFSKIQAVICSQSPFDRRHHMASVRVDTAGASRAGAVIEIPYLDFEIAERLARLLHDETAGRDFHWS